MVRWRSEGHDQLAALHQALDEMVDEATPILRASLAAGDG
jgi:hypothetical protein